MDKLKDQMDKTVKEIGKLVDELEQHPIGDTDFWFDKRLGAERPFEDLAEPIRPLIPEVNRAMENNEQV